MFAKLTGYIDDIGSNNVILDVGGVGYLVFASGRTLSRIGDKGEACKLLIETQVREDHIHLYGFCDALEKDWFNMLTTVQGVGAKAALAILAACPPESLISVIASGDKAALTQADGVGPKLALRILTELKDKADKLQLGSAAQISIQDGRKFISAGEQEAGSVMNDALSALVNLGYGRAEAYTALTKVQKQAENDNLDISAMIKLGLQELNR